MNRRISWDSCELEEIELVYEKAEADNDIGNLMEQLETLALSEAKANIGMLKTRNGDSLSPNQFDSLSDTDKETIVKVLGDIGLAAMNTDIQNAVIIMKLSPLFPVVQGCTIFNILNRIENLDGSINILKPKWRLNLYVPLGGRKGLLQWEMMIMLLYPWLSISEESSNDTGITTGGMGKTGKICM